ncbi:MAG: hypothetical protein ACLFTT_14915 [Candidatus Hydrogenedentota bacterium]
MRHFAPIVLACVFLVLFAAPALAAETGQAEPNPIDPIALVSRWAHILAAIFMLGGAAFIRFIMTPSVNEVISGEDHARLRPVLMRRWRWVVHSSIALFLLSGFYNYLAVTAPNHPGDGLYHALFGIKFILAVVVFGLASMLVSTREKENLFRRNPRVWMAVTVALAVIAVLIAGVMKLR